MAKMLVCMCVRPCTFKVKQYAIFYFSQENAIDCTRASLPPGYVSIAHLKPGPQKSKHMPPAACCSQHMIWYAF